MRALLAALLLASSPAWASFEDLGAGARAPGLGDAFTPLADDVYALHYNPAGLAQLDRSQMSAAYSKLYTGLSDGSDLGTSQLLYAHPLKGGKRGTYGIGWERFALSGLYQEQTLSFGYGRLVRESESGSRLMLGLTAKYLTHSFGGSSEAANACVGASCGLNGSDPILSGKSSKSAMDADFGVLYRFPRRFQLGFAVQHLMSPDVGFGGGDKLERAMKLALAYKSVWLSLVGELKESTAGGTKSREAIFGAERYFPSLDYGQFGLRGSLGFGTGAWQQMTLGGSYRINKIQADYAYLIPIGTVGGQSGSHRLALTFYFGAPSPDEELTHDLLEQAKRLREHGPDYGYEYSDELRPQDLNDPRLADVRRLIEDRKYRLAHKALVDFAEKQPQNQPLSPALLRLSNRLELVAYYYADIPEPKDRFDHTIVSALHRFLYGSDRLSMLQMSYAYSLRNEDARVGHLLDALEKAVGLKADRLPSDHPRSFIDEMLWRVEFANTRGEQAKVESTLADILVLEPENATALERLGSFRYLGGRYAEAIQAWEAAAKVEKREHEIESIREYIKLAQERATGVALPGGLAPLAVAPAAIAPATPAPAPAPAAAPQTVVIPSVVVPTIPGASVPVQPAPTAEPAPAPAVEAPKPVVPPAPAPKAAGPAGDPRDVQALYQKGIEFYARGEYLQASSVFQKILRIDPNNEQARKALERIDRRARR